MFMFKLKRSVRAVELQQRDHPSLEPGEGVGVLDADCAHVGEEQSASFLQGGFYKSVASTRLASRRT